MGSVSVLYSLTLAVKVLTPVLETYSLAVKSSKIPENEASYRLPRKIFQCQMLPENIFLKHATQIAKLLYFFIFFLEKEDAPRSLHLGDAYGHFINYSHKTLQSDTAVRLKPPSKQQTVATPIQLMKGRR